MSKKRDPVIAVLKYFQEAELSLAHQALALAQQTLRARVPSPRLVTKKAPPARAAGEPGA
jgi:type II secretory pathway component HofQ